MGFGVAESRHIKSGTWKGSIYELLVTQVVCPLTWFRAGSPLSIAGDEWLLPTFFPAFVSLVALGFPCAYSCVSTPFCIAGDAWFSVTT